MVKILIIDNRPVRQDILLNPSDRERLSSMKNVVFLPGINEINECINYDIIAIHRTYANDNNIYDKLLSLSKDHYIILFSGSYTQPIVSESGHIAMMGAKTFYSNLSFFCGALNKSEDIQLYKLIYHSSWKLPLYMRLRQLLWLDPEDRDIEDLIEALDINIPLEDNIKAVNQLSEEIRNMLYRRYESSNNS